MKRYITATLVFFSLATGMAAVASATTLGLSTGAPSISSSFAFIDYLEFGPDGDLSTFGAEVDFADGVSPVGFTEIGFGIGFPLATPTVGASGGFDVFDDNGQFLSGDLVAVGYTQDIIELQFGNLGGTAAGDFGSSVLAIIAFADPLGPNPFAALVDGEFYEASISISKVNTVAAVPLPAAFPLLGAGLGFIAFIGLWRNQRMI